MTFFSLETFNIVCYVWLGIAVCVHVAMFFVVAPFGRHTSTKWGATMDNRLAWIVMELISLAIMLFFLFAGTLSFQSYAWVLFAFWILHYVNRSLVYPFRIKSANKRMPVLIMANAIIFNVMNAGLNGYFLAELASPEKYGAEWLSSPLFIAGAVLFLSGMAINWIADTILIGLRKPGETGYVIPKGFLFDYVASPNLFGEVIEWIGFALMAWNLPALTFAAWTFANLVPRAKNHLDWYRSNFPDFPKKRKAIFPGIF